MAGLFITFEGVDGCGKSTQIGFLAEHLEKLGHDVLLTREPGGSDISEQIRSLLLDARNSSMTPETEALLYAAARAQHVEEVIRPALQAGKTVISDRFLDSSLAYQGGGRGLGHALILMLNAPGVGILRPDLTFFLDFPPQKAFERMRRTGQYDRLERQEAAFFERLYRDFQQIQAADPERVRRIDVSGSKQETQQKIRKVMDAFLRQREGAA